jgi:hypothetical protein
MLVNKPIMCTKSLFIKQKINLKVITMEKKIFILISAIFNK